MRKLLRLYLILQWFAFTIMFVSGFSFQYPIDPQQYGYYLSYAGLQGVIAFIVLLTWIVNTVSK